MVVQAVLVNKKYYSPVEAEIIARHFGKPMKVAHTTQKYYRYRMRNPKDFDATSFRTLKRPGQKGVRIIIGDLNG